MTRWVLALPVILFHPFPPAFQKHAVHILPSPHGLLCPAMPAPRAGSPTSYFRSIGPSPHWLLCINIVYSHLSYCTISFSRTRSPFKTCVHLPLHLTQKLAHKCGSGRGLCYLTLFRDLLSFGTRVLLWNGSLRCLAQRSPFGIENDI